MFLRLFVLLIFMGSIFVANSSQKMVSQADSLFAQQKYTEAFGLYEQVFESGRVSASMLLKMAFIKDGLGNYVDALYYLDLYYKKSADKSVVTKIEEISEEKSLEGYSYNDSHFFGAILNKYQIQAQLTLLAISLFLTAYIFRKRQQKERPITASVFQLLVIAALLFVTNSAFQKDQGIINQSNTLLRSGPSAGAEPIQLIEKGHKVQILDRSEVWTKINWQGEEVFVRNGRIKII